MAFRQTGVARRLLVGQPPNQLTIDSDGIRLPLAIDTPTDESTIEWYDALGTVPASISAIRTTLGEDLLALRTSDALYLEADNLADVRATVGGQLRLTSEARLSSTLGPVRLIPGTGGGIDLQGPPQAASRHAAGRLGDFTRAAAANFPAAGGVIGNSPPITFRPNRLVRLELSVPQIGASVVGGLWTISVENVSGGTYGDVDYRAVTLGGDGGKTWAWHVVPSTTVTHNLRIRAVNVSGGGTLQFAPTTFSPAALLVVTDQGPA